jgi:hypothetical protein
MTFTQYLAPDFIYNSSYVVSSVFVLGIGLVFLYVLSNGPKTIPTPTDATRPRDPARLAENLPTDVAISPEDFRNDPELLDVFEITDINNVNIILAKGLAQIKTWPVRSRPSDPPEGVTWKATEPEKTDASVLVTLELLSLHTLLL